MSQENNNAQTINLNELSVQQLDQVAVNISIQIAQVELNKANLLQSLAFVLSKIEERKANENKTDEINLPKLSKVNSPSTSTE